MAKIVFFELEPWEKKYFSEKLKKHTLVFMDSDLNNRTVKKIKDAEVLVLFVHTTVDSNVLKQMKKLKLIATMSTGFDHIDIAACKSMNIEVCNVPFYGENTVAEYTFALILSLSRKIHKTYSRTVRGDFSIKDIRGFDLKGKTLGVIGTGHIGQHVIKMAKGFEMNVLGFAQHKDKKIAKELGFSYVSMDKLLKSSDVITLHLPYSKDTHHLINKDVVKKMKKDVIIINTSRGAIIDTSALLYGLKNNIISGAGLDVLEAECFIEDEKKLLKTRYVDQCQLRTMLENHALLENDNVLITPHNAWNTKEAIIRILGCTVDNITCFFQSKKSKTNKIIKNKVA